MIPAPDLQLQVVIKALRDTVMPAVDPDNRVALEQLGLSLATLDMVRARLPDVAAREWQDLADAVTLGRAIVAAGPFADIEALIGAGEALLGTAPPAAGALGAAQQAILSAVTRVVREASDADAGELMRLVVEGSKPATDLARAWSKAAGFEPDPDEVPDLAALLATRT